MSDRFAAQSLIESKTTEDGCRFELTFVGGKGEKHTISLPVGVAADLAPVLTALAKTTSANAVKFTRIPERWAVGTAKHERLVLIQFDDDPPYGLDLEVAETLWRELREGQEAVSRRRAPALQ
jgi:hypothetical protein